MPTFNIGGAVSGMDTNAMIDQLMELERRPIQRKEQRIDDHRAAHEAWGRLGDEVGALASLAEGLSGGDAFAGAFAVGSSDDGVLTGRQITGEEPAEGWHELEVEQLARRAQVASVDTFADPDAALIAEDGNLELTVAGETTEVELAAGDSLREVAERINDAQAGAHAQVLRTGADEHRLVLTTDATGADQDITVDAAPDGFPDDVEVTQEGQDAILHHGGVEIHRDGNTVDDVIDGLELSLHSAEPGQTVTLTVERDVDAAVEQVADLVAQLNVALEVAGELGHTDEDPDERGELAGDSAVRSLQNRLTRAIGSGLSGPDGLVPANEVGLETTRDGEITLDEGRLRTALQDDFEGTLALLGRTATALDDAAGIESVSAASRAADGTYAVEITSAATRAGVVADLDGDRTDPVTFTLEAGSSAAEVTVGADADLAEAVEAINAALDDAGISRVRAEDDEGQLALTSLNWGSAGDFTVSPEADGLVDGQISGEHTGDDVEGSVGGEAAEGVGRILRGQGAAEGVIVTTDVTEEDVGGEPFDAGSVRVSSGLGGALERVTRDYEGFTGRIQGAQRRLEGQIERTQNRIASFEDRLEVRRRTLMRQFTAMEQAMARLQDQGQAMMQQLAGMQQ